MIRWIAFDAVGTVIYPEPDVATAYAVIGQNYGSVQSPAELRPRFARVFTESLTVCLPHENGDVFTTEDLEVERWRWIVQQMLPDVSDLESCFQELYDHFGQAKHWRVFPDVQETLSALSSRSLRLAIASNFDQRLHPVCQDFAEFDTIERIIVSTEVNACKPSSRFYEGLLRACDCGTDELLMVGDEFDSDVAGPQALGIRSVWLDRKSSGQHRHPSTIHSLTELLALLDGSQR